MRADISILLLSLSSLVTLACSAAGGAVDAPLDEVADTGAPDSGSGFGHGLERDAAPSSDANVDAPGSCARGATKSCYPGDMATLGKGACTSGTQHCIGSGELGTWGDCEGAVTPIEEICGNGIDDDCDGEIDEGCIIDVPVDLSGDCVSASCPAIAPYPVGCKITMSGGDDRGCVAWSKGSSSVFFKEGNECGAGHLTGILRCSSVDMGGINATTCIINKSKRFYPTTSAGCPK